MKLIIKKIENPSFKGGDGVYGGVVCGIVDGKINYSFDGMNLVFSFKFDGEYKGVEQKTINQEIDEYFEGNKMNEVLYNLKRDAVWTAFCEKHYNDYCSNIIGYKVELVTIDGSYLCDDFDQVCDAFTDNSIDVVDEDKLKADIMKAALSEFDDVIVVSEDDDIDTIIYDSDVNDLDTFEMYEDIEEENYHL